MELRTITLGAREGDVARGAQAAHALRTRLAEAGYVVQTLRCAPTVSGFNSCADLVSVAQGIEERAVDLGFDYATLGVVQRDRLNQLADAMAATQALFASVSLTHNGQVDESTIQQMAQIARFGTQSAGRCGESAGGGVGDGTSGESVLPGGVARWWCTVVGDGS